jgi:hypothetical protein
MTMRRLAVWCAAGLLMGAGSRGYAADDAPLALHVKPVLCIADRFSPSCAMAFQVRWQSAREGDFCLNDDIRETPLRCWGRARAGELRENRVVSQDFTYWMSSPARDARLAEVKVEVLRVGTADRRRERRTRHVWDVL